VGAAGHLNETKIRFAALGRSTRPFFIKDLDWKIFLGYAAAE
jgi:hypothetical protein